ncbi:hypothetical protein Pelo_5217 [Pelomyxa schiedti]|nr:hypothetical protein Pelo_5217 [Pelomyxa schiedti]
MTALHHEYQLVRNTCFVHATNMYFQDPTYATRLVKGAKTNCTGPAEAEPREGAADGGGGTIVGYVSMLRRCASRIEEIIREESARSFYAHCGTNGAPPEDKDTVEEDSRPTKDSDLLGYYQVYSYTCVEEVIRALCSDGLVELTPPEALFFLEFQLSANGKNLVYVPHSFYHRHARSALPGDYKCSAALFSAALTSEYHSPPDGATGGVPLFLCRVEPNHSHAFTALNMGPQRGVILLDSLCCGPVEIPTVHEFVSKKEYAARASCMIIPDRSRPSIVLI